MPRDLTEPLRELRIPVTSEEEGERLDRWLSRRLPWRSREDLVARIESGRILVDDLTVKKSHRVRRGEVVRVAIEESGEAAESPEPRLRFLFEDDALLALDKPPGSVVHPVGGHVSQTLLNALHRHYRDAGSHVRPMIVHRLDKETSGVLVLAKDEETRKELGRDFEERRVEKTYVAFVRGHPPTERGVIDQPIGVDPTSPGGVKMCVCPDGRPSLTEYELVEARGLFSVIRCRPRTGRQHQIRVHLAALGTPILGDWLYGSPPPVPLEALVPGGPAGTIALQRLGLHAEELVFRHPKDGAVLRIRAPLAEDLSETLRRVDAILPR